MYSFLLLSSLSGIVELGSVFLGIHLDVPTPVAISFPLFYQLGNLMMNIIPNNRNIRITISIIVIILTIFSFTKCEYISLATQLVLTSFCIQAARNTYKKKCPVSLKRMFRISGFLFSPLMLLVNGQLIIIISAIICFILTQKSVVQPTTHPNYDSKPISLVMIFHQMHYFVYTYIMPIYLFQITNSYIISGIAFAVTWVVYILPQTIASKYNLTCYSFIFFMCHSFLAICMLIMALASLQENCLLVMFFWLLTGLGGGSVFCIKNLSKRYSQINMEFSENIGHSIGPMIAIVLCTLFPEKEVTYLSFASFGFVLIAIIIANEIRKEKRNKNER